MKTLYISDLDGTLLNSSAELSVYTTNALNRLIADGMHFSAATARTASTTLQMFEGVALNTPIVLMNGVLIYDPTCNQYINREIISDTAKSGIIDAMHEAEQSCLMYALCGEKMSTYYRNPVNTMLRDFMDERIGKYNKIFTPVEDFATVTNDIIYFCFLDEQENIERIYSLISDIDGPKTEKYRDIYSKHLWYLEVFSANASKRCAVDFLRKHGGYDRIIGFGDNLNDLPLFHACDECYAVANAKDELKQIATAVIGRNDEDSVVRWLEGVRQS